MEHTRVKRLELYGRDTLSCPSLWLFDDYERVVVQAAQQMKRMLILHEFIDWMTTKTQDPSTFCPIEKCGDFNVCVEDVTEKWKIELLIFLDFLFDRMHHCRLAEILSF